MDKKKDQALLTLRADNVMWCLPGGLVNPVEIVAESCLRAVLEETGLMIRIKRLTGVYSDPDKLEFYPDGNPSLYHLLELRSRVGERENWFEG